MNRLCVLAWALWIWTAVDATVWGSPMPLSRQPFGLPVPLGASSLGGPREAASPHPAVARIIVAEGEGRMSLGSGTLVAVSGRHGLVMTNWHVVCDARDSVTVAFPGGFRSPASIVKTDRDWDLAALVIWRPPVEPVLMAGNVPRPGEPLSIAGYGSNSYRAVAGRCTQYLSPGNALPFELVELSAGARQGDSGGPIFNSRGELAGVLFGSALGRTTGSHCGRVRQFLGDVAPRFEALERESEMTGMIASTQPESPPAAPAAQTNQVATKPQPDAGLARPETVRPASPPPAVRIEGGWQTAAPREVAQSPVPQNVGPVASVAPLTRPDPPAAAQPVQPQTELLTWSDLAGPTRADQVKSVLAAVGVLAIVFHALRLLGPSRPTEPPKTGQVVARPGGKARKTS